MCGEGGRFTIEGEPDGPGAQWRTRKSLVGARISCQLRPRPLRPTHGLALCAIDRFSGVLRKKHSKFKNLGL